MKLLPSGLLLALIFVPISDIQGQIAIIRNPIGPRPSVEFRVTSVDVQADIKDQVATVQIAQVFQNTSSRTLETQFLFPMPDGAAINGLTLIVDGKELIGELKPKDEARREYEQIVRQQKDPALLEYMGRGLFKTSVFPIPAGQNRRVEIRYTQLLKSDTGLVDFTLPLGLSKHSQQAIEEMNVTIRVKSEEELKNIYSPTHEFKIDRPGEKQATCRLTLKNVQQPNDVRLLYGTKGSDIGMNLISYRPDSDEQGYFLLLATPRVKAKNDAAFPKTILFVVDRSGSMSGEKTEQAKASLKYMINSLSDHDTFNIISYSSEVDLFRPELELVTSETRKNAIEYVDDIYSGGGTNINGALTTALEQLKDKKRPSYVLFLTDGLPTVGETTEAAITANVKRANTVNARVFSFGVGYDVNSRLLDRLSRDQRGTSVYVKPEEDFEVAATNLFRKVSSPAMTDVKISFVKHGNTESASDSIKVVNRLYPRELPDLFRGEQLIIVGRYKKNTAVTVELTGVVADKTRTLNLETEFGDADSTRRNGFVQTLWATRRIGEIIDELDLNGQNKELVDELVALSLKYGIMTPYTSFLADESVSFGDRSRLLTEAEFRSAEGLSVASGRAGFVQRDFKKSLQNAARATSGLFGSGNSSDASGSGLGGYPGGRLQSGGVATELARSGSARSQTGFGRSAATPSGQATGGRGVAAADAVSTNDASSTHEKIKRVGSKTFYWKENEWQDSELSKLGAVPEESDIIRIEQFSDRYFDRTKQKNSRWTIYLSLDEPVLIQIGTKIYRISPPAETTKVE